MRFPKEARACCEASRKAATPLWKSPLDRSLDWTEFPDQWAKSKRIFRSSLRELAQRIQRTCAASKEELPWLKLGPFGDTPTTKGSLRSNANLIAINGIELDYDDGDVTWDQALARLYEAGIPALLYTTRRHTSEKPRFRILIPTSRALPPEERARLVARAYGVVKGTIDGASFTQSQCFYYGFPVGVRMFVELIDPPGGRFIDLADDLDAGALGKDGKPYGRPAANDDSYDYDDDDLDLEPEPDVERIRYALDIIPAEEMERYGTWLETGQALNHEFGGDPEGLDLWDEASQRCPSYDRDELERKYASFGNFGGKPVTIASLYRLAKIYAPKTMRAQGGLIFETPAECANAPMQPYVVKGMIAEGDIGCIFGPPGAGKSLLAPFICYQVALGESAFGMRTKQGRVFYCAAEDATGLRQRVAALRIRQGDAPELRVVSGISDLFSDDSPDLDQLLEAVEFETPKLIVIDTLAMAFPGLEENDSTGMGRVVAVGRKLAEHGAAVIFVHHGTKADGSTPRGHSVFNGALDFSMQVTKDDQGIVRGNLRKNRRGTTEKDIAFKIGVEKLGEDEDGDPITAAVAEELSAGEAARQPGLTPQQRTALQILEELEGEGTVNLQRWAEVTSERYRISDSPNPKSRQTAFRRAREALLKAGLISVDPRGNVRSVRPWDVEDDQFDI